MPLLLSGNHCGLNSVQPGSSEHARGIPCAAGPDEEDLTLHAPPQPATASSPSGSSTSSLLCAVGHFLHGLRATMCLVSCNLTGLIPAGNERPLPLSSCLNWALCTVNAIVWVSQGAVHNRAERLGNPDPMCRSRSCRMYNWPLFSWLLETCSALGARHLLSKRGRPSLWREVNSLFTWSSTQKPWCDL